MKVNFFKYFNEPRIIAEIGQSHEGKLSKAKHLIKEISAAGADIVKFQTHIANAESSKDDKFRKNFKLKSITRHQYWKKNEFSFKEWGEIIKFCKKKKIKFLTSLFSVKSYHLLKPFGINTWKIGSGEFFSEDLLNELIKEKQNLIISTGMSTSNDIERLNTKLKKRKIKYSLLQCVSSYPSEIKKTGINIINELRDKYAVPTGLSDHSGSIYPALLALALGANIVEVHITENKNDGLPDSTSSIDLNELKLLVAAKKNFVLMLKNKIKKNKLSLTQKTNKRLFTKSATLINPIKKGQTIKYDNIVFKKPGFGYSYNDLSKIINTKAKIDIESNILIKKKHFK